jgi:hypothetical protein
MFHHVWREWPGSVVQVTLRCNAKVVFLSASASEIDQIPVVTHHVRREKGENQMALLPTFERNLVSSSRLAGINAFGCGCFKSSL